MALGPLQTAVAPLMRSVAARTVTLTVAVVLPKSSLAVSSKVRVTGSLKPTAGATNVGVSVSTPMSVTNGPTVFVCLQANVAPLKAFGSSVTVAKSETGSPEPTAMSGPRFTIGAVPPPLQLAGTGGCDPGHGVSWPTTGPTPSSGPEPSARNGRSWKLFGGSGWPNLKPSGKMKSKFGARYCPDPRPFANPSPPGSDAGVVPS